MGSSAFKAGELPVEVKERIDDAIDRGMTVIVAEAHGACRAFQDYLHSKGYGNVVVGYAKSMRYNAGGWPTKQYGLELKDRERAMIEDCDEAAVIWVNNSGVIANNLELLKRLGKPTFIYELSTKTGKTNSGMLDPKRVYNPHYYWAEYYRKRKRAQP
jgi:hypothetical protein